MNVNTLKQITLCAADFLEQSYSCTTHNYGISMEEAAKRACRHLGADEDVGSLVRLVLDGRWNEVLGWAGDYKDRERYKDPNQ